jgi:hypothetical protein
MRMVSEDNVRSRLQCMRKRRKKRIRSQNIERVKAILLTKLSTD